MKNKFTTVITIIFVLLAASIFIASCEKDEVDVPQTVSVTDTIPTQFTTDQQVFPRSGGADVIFYRTSLTTDNYLVLQTAGRRIYNIFNKSKVREIKFTATTQPMINVNGVFMKHYRIEVVFTDFTTRTFNAYSKSSSNVFTYTPNGTNQLSDTHTAKFLQIEEVVPSANGYQYNIWRDNTITSKSWTIKKDGITTIATKSLDPINRNSNIFVPVHID